MNDNDIVKALECCSKGDFRNCQECKYLYAEVEETENCNDVLAKDALDLINRQKAEIERLKECKRIIEYQRDRLDEEIEELHSELRGLNFMRKQIKSEAIKEFAERLKGMWTIPSPEPYNTDAAEVLDSIDNLVKEMVGERE